MKTNNSSATAKGHLLLYCILLTPLLIIGCAETNVQKPTVKQFFTSPGDSVNSWVRINKRPNPFTGDHAHFIVVSPQVVNGYISDTSGNKIQFCFRVKFPEGEYWVDVFPDSDSGIVLPNISWLHVGFEDGTDKRFPLLN